MLVNQEAFENGDIQEIAAAFGAADVKWDLTVPAVVFTGLRDKVVPEEMVTTVQLVGGQDLWVLTDRTVDASLTWLEATHPELLAKVDPLLGRVGHEQD